MALVIQPPNFSKKTSAGNVSLVWNPTFGAVYSSRFHQAQVYVDSEVLRYCDPLVPMRTGALKNSGKSGTNLGDGEVKYTVPYAAFQYYSTAQTRDYDPQRGGYWFERMKTAHISDIKKGCSRILKGG